MIEVNTNIVSNIFLKRKKIMIKNQILVSIDVNKLQLVTLSNVKLSFKCNINHNKHCILYIVIGQTIRFTSHVS